MMFPDRFRHFFRAYTDLVTKGVSKLKHFDEIRWTGYMGSDSREAHKIDPHTRYGASTNFLHEYSLFKNSMRLLKTKNKFQISILNFDIFDELFP